MSRHLAAITPLAIVAALVASGCNSRQPSAGSAVSVAPVATTSPATTTTVPTPTSTAPPTTATPTSATTASTAPPTTAAPTSTSAIPTTRPPESVGPGQPFDLSADKVAVGTSVEGREIVAERYGDIGGRRILIIGVIHGNEPAGTAIVDALRTKAVPAGNELWLVESMNPDGLAVNDRRNANQVDLNRNFPYGWEPLGQPGDGQYGGTGPASEPETQAMVAFITQLQPDITIWYHQDLDVIAPAKGRDGEIRSRYAELTNMRIESAPFNYAGAKYTGVAATWARHTLAPIGAVPFIVELGPTLSPEAAEAHAQAIITIAAEM